MATVGRTEKDIADTLRAMAQADGSKATARQSLDHAGTALAALASTEEDIVRELTKLAAAQRPGASRDSCVLTGRGGSARCHGAER